MTNAAARRAYEEAIAPASRACDEAMATAYRACDEAMATAYRAYDEATKNPQGERKMSKEQDARRAWGGAALMYGAILVSTAIVLTVVVKVLAWMLGPVLTDLVQAGLEGAGR